MGRIYALYIDGFITAFFKKKKILDHVIKHIYQKIRNESKFEYHIIDPFNEESEYVYMVRTDEKEPIDYYFSNKEDAEIKRKKILVSKKKIRVYIYKVTIDIQYRSGCLNECPKDEMSKGYRLWFM